MAPDAVVYVDSGSESQDHQGFNVVADGLTIVFNHQNILDVIRTWP